MREEKRKKGKESRKQMNLDSRKVGWYGLGNNRGSGGYGDRRSERWNGVVDC
jgi:hypothetical protein